MPDSKFVIKKKRNLLGRWHWWVVLVAENGEVLSTSETLTSDHAAMINIESQKANAIHAAVERE